MEEIFWLLQKSFVMFLHVLAMVQPRPVSLPSIPINRKVKIGMNGMTRWQRRVGRTRIRYPKSEDKFMCSNSTMSYHVLLSNLFHYFETFKLEKMSSCRHPARICTLSGWSWTCRNRSWHIRELVRKSRSAALAAASCNCSFDKPSPIFEYRR